MNLGSDLRILFLHDHTLQEIPDGGAQRTTHELLARCPYETGFHTPATFDQVDAQAYDMLIVSNCKFFTDAQLEKILAHRFFIKFERDYYNLARPGQEDYRRALFERSRCNIFLSPGHRDAFMAEHPDIDWRMTENLVHPPPVDVGTFNPRGQRREDVYAAVTSIFPHKGVDNLVAWVQATGNRLEVYGRGEKPLVEQLQAQPGIYYQGSVSYAEMPGILNRVRGLVHLPNWVEPFGRSVAEARLCGCEMVLNDRVGAATYDWFWDYSEFWYRMSTAAESFWKLTGELRQR